MTLRLAPLAGVSDWPFRVLCFEQECDCAYTEMVSALGVTYGSSHEATKHLLHRDAREKKLIVQLFGKEPDVLGNVARQLSEMERFDGIDLNMGCPVRKVACSGEGSGLMRTPELAEQIMRAMVKQSGLPVSVKMRLGWDAEHINVCELAKRTEDAGVSEITIHARTRNQMYSGEADWEWIARVVECVRIPVIGNGDITSLEVAQKRIRETGVQGLMIGRAAQGNPWIFSSIQKGLRGETVRPPTLQERMQVAERHFRMLLSWKPERVAVGEMRKHLSWYLHGIRGAARVRERINHMEKAEEVFALLDEIALSDAHPETVDDGKVVL